MTPNWRRNSTPGAPRRPTASPPSPFARADRLLAPGSTIGILGGGQLGRMLAVAAAQLGYRTHVYAPDRESVAAQVAAQHSQAAWDDAPRLAAFAAACDVVTLEFENVRSEEHTSELQSLMRNSYAV